MPISDARRLSRRRSCYALLSVCLLLCGAPQAAVPLQAEMTAAKSWLATESGLCAQSENPPAFSFLYGDRPFSELFRQWRVEHFSEPAPDGAVRHLSVFTDPDTGLEARCELTAYADFPAVEWTLYLENKGGADTPVIGRLRPLDAPFLSATEPHTLRYARGSDATTSDFAPRERRLVGPLRLAPNGGRSSDGVLPFFNVMKPGGDGLVLGIGWTGQWEAVFSRTNDGAVMIGAGMEGVHLRLHPGEKIRTPAVLLLFWSGGDPARGNNLLRSLLLRHYTPAPDGKPVNPPVAVSPHGNIGFSDTSEANMVGLIDRVSEHRLPVDTFWIDAGWNGPQMEWARTVGTWEPNAERFPKGMRPVADAAYAAGLRFLLWFEPERVMPGTWLFNHHPDWLIAPGEMPQGLKYQKNDGFHLLNYGHPEALAWAKRAFSDFIRDSGLDIFRQDFNMAPLPYWREGESEDRQGMNEIRHITGLYDFFDTLLREHPGLLIDNCASGGRRIDFEMMRRSLALWRSDHCWDPTATQCMTHGLSQWIPMTGVGAVNPAPYPFRSGLGAHLSLALDYAGTAAVWEQAASELEKYSRVRHLFTADFYPLTPYTQKKSAWMAWQYHSPERGEGLVQVFRREECKEDNTLLRLRGLDLEAIYTVTDLDLNQPVQKKGKELLDTGLSVLAPQAPGALLIHYRATSGES